MRQFFSLCSVRISKGRELDFLEEHRMPKFYEGKVGKESKSSIFQLAGNSKSAGRLPEVSLAAAFRRHTTLLFRSAAYPSARFVC